MPTITTTELGAVGRYIDLGNDAADTSIAQTVLAYARPTANPENGFGYLFGRVSSGSINGHRFYTASVSNRLGFGGSCTGNADRPYLNNAPDTATLNSWWHWAATWDGGVSAATAVKFYVGNSGATLALDDSAFNTASGSGSGTNAVGKKLFLLNRDGLSRAFIGDVAYVARWNRVLSLAELQTAQASGPLAVPSGLTLCWANQQDYGPNTYAPVARSTFVAGALPPNLNLGGAGDTTAPILTSPAGTKTGATTASGTVVTDEANGTLYRLASTNASESGTTVKTGATQAVTATGSQSVTFTGLSPSTTYYAHYLHRDAAGNDSSVVSSASFTTDAAADTTPPTHTGVVTISALTHNSYTASWPAATDANGVTGYEYRIAAGAWVDVGVVLTTDITGRTPSATELFEVRAYDAAGNRSTPALSENVTLQDQPAPTGTVTISGVVPADTTAQVTYSYSAADQSGFEYRIDGGAAASIGASPATITGLTVDTSYALEIRAINAGGAGAWSAVTNFTTNAVIVVIHDIDAGNVDPAKVVITDGGTTTPNVFIDFRTAASAQGWRHLFFAVENVAGKRPVFDLNRSTRITTATPGTGWGLLWTQDFVTWTKSPQPSLIAGTPNKIRCQFTDPLPAGRVYLATQPMHPEGASATLANELLTTYASVASAPPSANASGVFNVSPAETDDIGRNVGGRNMYAVKLAWGGATTDGGPKRRLVMLSGIHAAGEGNASIAHRAALDWMLNSASAQAVAFRSNFDVYNYFNISPNGYAGGHARTNFRTPTDPNRSWSGTGLAEIVATKAAITTDLGLGSGGRWDAMFSWHAYYQDTNDWQCWTSVEDSVPETRSPAMQAMLDTGPSFFSDPVVIDDSGTNNTDVWWAKTSGAKIAFDTELQQNGDMSPAFFQSVAQKWLLTLQAVDAAGFLFSDIYADGAAAASGTASLGADVALAGVGVALATGQASGTVDIALAALGLSVASGAASLDSAAAGSLAASGTAQAGGSAGLAASVTIGAVGLAQAAASAGLSAVVLLAGAGAAQAAGNAALAATLSALAAGAAQSSGSATLSSAAAGELGAYGQAVAGGSAALVLTVRLAATGTAQAGGSAALSGGSAGELAASGAAQAAGAGVLTAGVTLTAAGFVQAMGAGYLVVQVPLEASGGAVASGGALLVDGNALVLISMPRWSVSAAGRRWEVWA